MTRTALSLVACFLCAVASAQVTPGPQARGGELLRMTLHSSFLDMDRDYWMYLPKGHGEADAARWPVILFLHGGGERGNDLNVVLKHGPIKEVTAMGRDLPFIIIAPQMPTIERETPRGQGRGGREGSGGGDARIAMVRETTGAEQPWEKLGPPKGWNELQDDLLAMVDRAVKEYHGDSNRLYVTGLSYGGFGTWYMLTHHADVWAAAAPICGAGENDEVHKAGKLPVWLFQGGRDRTVRPEWSLATADALDAAGGNVRVTVHEDCGHDCWTRVYEGQDIYTWFLSHTRDER